MRKKAKVAGIAMLVMFGGLLAAPSATALEAPPDGNCSGVPVWFRYTSNVKTGAAGESYQEWKVTVYNCTRSSVRRKVVLNNNFDYGCTSIPAGDSRSWTGVNQYVFLGSRYDGIAAC